MNHPILDTLGQQLRANLRSLIDEGHLPDPDATYIYGLNMIWGASASIMSGHIKVKYGVLVKNVRQREAGGYEFNLVGDDDPNLYHSNYAWAFIVNTPDNAERYKSVRALLREKRDLERKITAARNLVITLEKPKNVQTTRRNKSPTGAEGEA